MSSHTYPKSPGTPLFLGCEQPEQSARIQALGRQSGIPVLCGEQEGFCLSLSADGRFELYALRNPSVRIRADFTSAAFLYRLKTSGKQQPLAKAVGLAKGLTRVLDATGGLGGDAMVLASLGCEVTVCERHPLIALLLENGLEQAREELAFASRVHLISDSAFAYLAGITEYPQVIYLDPMYPAKEKSALPRKEMQILEDLVGIDVDQSELFALALSKATERVVVKRPKSAPPFAAPTHSFAGTTTRYDMYLTKRA